MSARGALKISSTPCHFATSPSQRQVQVNFTGGLIMTAGNRRQFLFASSGAAAGSFLASGVSESAESAPYDFSKSGLLTGNLKALKLKEIPGFLSAQQIAPHHSAHYGGALKAFVSIDTRFEEHFQKGTPIDPAAFETLQRQKSSRGNSVVLHEMYFDGLALKAPDPAEQLRRAIEQRFGTLEKWSADFMASAKVAAGWAMLVVHPVNGRLYNVVSDEHAQGPLWLATPLIVIDVYEHAFYIDYQNRKPEYIEKFMTHIDWDEANARFHTVHEHGK
jgi:Fe-Mn family superoxide dismutase